jgi:hypothetical protein
MSFRSRERPVAFVVLLLSTINILSVVVVGLGSVVANRIAYMVIHGDVPERVGHSPRKQWHGNMPVDLPWWYFAVSGALALTVALLVINPRWRFTPTDGRYFVYRTTPGFLTITGALVAFVSWGFARMYNVVDPGLYWIGIGMLAAAPVVTLATWRWGDPDEGTGGKYAAEIGQPRRKA